MPGINSPYVYVGKIFTYFCIHVEDSDLNSINYLHKGKQKIWYSSPPSEHEKLEELAKKVAAFLGEKCEFYLRHKSLLFPPSMMKEHGIKFTRVRLSKELSPIMNNFFYP